MDGVKTFYGKNPIFLVLCLCAKICFSEDMVAPGLALTRSGAKRCDDLPIAKRRTCLEDNASNHADLYGIHKTPMYINPRVMEGPGFAVENGGLRTGVINRLFNMKRFVTNVDNPDFYNIQTNFDQINSEGYTIEQLYSLCLDVNWIPDTFIDLLCNWIALRELESKYGNEYNTFSENLPVKNSKGVPNHHTWETDSGDVAETYPSPCQDANWGPETVLGFLCITIGSEQNSESGNGYNPFDQYEPVTSKRGVFIQDMEEEKNVGKVVLGDNKYSYAAVDRTPGRYEGNRPGHQSGHWDYDPDHMPATRQRIGISGLRILKRLTEFQTNWQPELHASPSEQRGGRKQSGRNNGYLGGFRGGRWNVHLS